MAKTLYAPLNGVSDKAKKILVSTGGLSDYVIKGYCSVNGVSKQFLGSNPGGLAHVIFENGGFGNVTSPNCRTNTIVNGGSMGHASETSEGAIRDKYLSWVHSYSSENAWTITNQQIVSGNMRNVTGVQDNNSNILMIPVIGDIVKWKSEGSAIGAILRITLTAKETTGQFAFGYGWAAQGTTYRYWDAWLKKTIAFGSAEYPLDTVLTIDFDLTNNILYSITRRFTDGYWWIGVCAPPNYGYTPRVYIDKIEYIDLNS